MRKGSPTEKDVNRWAEMIDNPEIENYDDFSKEWDKYFDEDINVGKRIKRESHLKERTFKRLLTFRPDIAGKIIIKRGKPAKKVIVKELKYIGRVKGKVVRVERVFILYKGKKFLRHRDRFGRFASIKKGSKRK